MEIGSFLDDTYSSDQYIPYGLGFETTMNITLTAILAQLIGINRNLEDISNTLKEFIVEDDEDE